jgi:hypothetical protein
LADFFKIFSSETVWPNEPKLTKFQFIWENSFRGEDFLEINQSETRMACGGHVCKRIGTKWAIFIEDLP